MRMGHLSRIRRDKCPLKIRILIGNILFDKCARKRHILHQLEPYVGWIMLTQVTYGFNYLRLATWLS
jgi:hypothetical protein